MHFTNDVRRMFSDELDTLVLFITSICNQRCASCFYWQSLNRKDDMSKDDIERISNTVGTLRSLFISGGEPFLHKEIDEVLSMFRVNASVESISIPTNGMLAKRTAEKVSSFMDEHGDVTLRINVSIDGFKETHDYIRQVPDAYERALETVEVLKGLKSKYPNLYLFVTTTLCEANHQEAEVFSTFVMDELGVDGHNLGVIRGDSKDPAFMRNRKVVAETYRRLYEKQLTNYAYALAKHSKNGHSFMSALKDYLVSAANLSQFQTKYDTLLHDTRWGYSCVAGRGIAVVDANGDLRACELREHILNLREFDFDLLAALASQRMEQERRQIIVDQCDRECPHGCFITVSFRRSPLAVVKETPPALLKLMALRYTA